MNLTHRGTLAQLGRYAAFGGGATVAHWLLLTLLVEQAHWAAWAGSGAGALLGSQVAFFANRRYTFGHGGVLWPAWWRFMVTALIGAVVGMGVVAWGVALGLHYLAAQTLATALGLLLTFAINRAWTFG